MSARARGRAPAPSDDGFVPWRVSGALFVALAVATGGLHVVFVDQTWWLLVVGVLAAVLGSAGLARGFLRRRGMPTVVSAGVLLALLTLLFAPGSALLAIIPTPGTAEAFLSLIGDASASISRQAIPAVADASIVFVLCAGVGLLAVLCDALAVTLRAPALVGVPLLVLLAIPAFTAENITDLFVFALSAAAYLVLLLAGSTHRQTGLATAIAGTAIIGSLVLPAVLPSADDGTSTRQAGVSTGVNPVLGLGDDLRRASEREVITYTTQSAEDETVSGDGQYLRLVTLEDFTGTEWAPTERGADSANTVDEFGPVPGLAPEVATVPLTSEISIGSLTSRWLPLPYPPRTVTGVDDDWLWEAEGFSVSNPGDSARGEDYQVESLLVRPTPEQLLQSGTTVNADLEAYLDLPSDLPPVIVDTAVAVGAESASNYEKALALQEFFRSGEFRYSENAPVTGDYDGTGMEVIATFLEERAGYCVHFASSMSVMARSIGIPARVVVGFLPGTPTPVQDGTEFTVTTHDLHAWPELYFDGIGWVQFEPTPGRGALGDYANPEAAGVPAPVAPQTPDEAEAPAPAPSASLPPEDAGLDGGGSAAVDPASRTPWVALSLLGLLALSLIPAVARASQRTRLAARLRSGDGSAIDAWTETTRTALDLRLPVTPTATPRETAAMLGGGMGSATADALNRLLVAVEREGYSESASTDQPQVARDLARVRAGLLEAATPRRRLLARLAPVSLWRRILHPLTPTALAARGARANAVVDR